MRIFFSACVAILVGSAFPASAKHPDCAGTDRWPTMSAFVQLENAGTTDHGRIDLPKTTTKRIASQRISDDLYRQVHRVQFVEKSGRTITVITVNDASSVECSMSPVDLFLVQPLKR